MRFENILNIQRFWKISLIGNRNLVAGFLLEGTRRVSNQGKGISPEWSMKKK